MFAYLKTNKKGSKDIVIARLIGDEQQINKRLPMDKTLNYPINSFVYQAMNYYYNEDGLLFNNFADSNMLFKGDFINNLYAIKGWLNYNNENTAKLRIYNISHNFGRFYYDILPIVKIKEIETFPMLKLPMVVDSLDVDKNRKQEIYRDILVSAMNNEQFLTILKNHVSIEKKNDKVKVK